MNNSKDGGPAFPKPIGNNGLSHHEEHQHSPEQVGMTLREYFAGLAMQGQIACPVVADGTPESVAMWAVKHADALLNELRKEQSREQG